MDGELGIPNCDADDPCSKHGNEDAPVPPFGDLLVPGHEAGMDVWLLMHGLARLSPDLLAMVQEGMGDECCNRREGKAVGNRECGGEEEGTICLIFRQIEGVVVSEDFTDIVIVSGVVEGSATRDGQICGVPGVGVVEDWGEDPEEKRKSCSDVGFRPPRRGEG